MRANIYKTPEYSDSTVALLATSSEVAALAEASASTLLHAELDGDDLPAVVRDTLNLIAQYEEPHRSDWFTMTVGQCLDVADTLERYAPAGIYDSGARPCAANIGTRMRVTVQMRLLAPELYRDIESGLNTQ